MIQVLEMNASLIKIKYMAQKILQLIGDPNKSKQYKRNNIFFLFPVHIGLHLSSFFYSYKFWTFNQGKWYISHLLQCIDFQSSPPLLKT